MSTGSALRLDAGHGQVDGTDAAVHGRVVILAAGRHFHHLGLNVLGNLADALDGVPGVAELVEGTDRGDQHGRRAGDPRARRDSELVSTSMPPSGTKRFTTWAASVWRWRGAASRVERLRTSLRCSGPVTEG